MSAPAVTSNAPSLSRRQALRRPFEQPEQSRFDRYGHGGCQSVEAADFAAVAVDSQLTFETVDEVESVFADLESFGSAVGQDHLEVGGHRAPRQVHQGDLGRIAGFILEVFEQGGVRRGRRAPGRRWRRGGGRGSRGGS